MGPDLDSNQGPTEAWQTVKGNAGDRATLQAPTPNLPENYKEVFRRCIELAEPDVAEYLAYMLMRLQVHQSRMQELANALRTRGGVIIVPQNIIFLFV